MGDGGASVRDIILSGCGSDFDPEWASLPLLVVFLVLDKLMEPIDHVRFAAVCKEWSCLAKDYNRSTQRWSPMLMIPTQLAKSNQTLVYSDFEGKIYKNIQGIELPEPMPKTEITHIYNPIYNRHCCSAGYGWLAIVDCYYHYQGGNRHHRVIITLSNPFSSSKAVPPSHISLPPLESKDILFALSSGREVETRAKVMLSADPALNPDSYAVIAFFPGDFHIFYTGARFTEEGRSIWRNHRNASFQFYDAIFYKGLVYAADHVRGSIHSFDLNLMMEEIFDYSRTCFPAQPYYDMFEHHPFCPPYVVKSTKGDLLHVVRFCELKKEDGSSSSSSSSSSRGEYITTHFMVFKVPPFNDEECESYESGEYVELESLGDEALFVGDNYSVSVLASKFGGCQPNCIYFTDDSINFRQNASIACDMGIFNLEDGTIARHCPPSCWEKGMPTPFWITPPFRGLY
ncbi:hypothetical protein GBA52_018183 [Prunus armeniaca]|nr:hypothetical protein GBA52_018183 [Prunus armeniaca]